MKIALNNSIQGAHPLISVWDMMTQLKIGQLAANLEQLHAGTTMEIPGETRPFLVCIQNLGTLISDLSKHSEELNLVETKGRCDRFAKNLHTAFIIALGDVDPLDLVGEIGIQTEILAIEATILRELSAHLFVQIPCELVKYFEQTNFFGQSVALAFPSAVFDIKEAAQCLSMSLNTAAVFHAMRVVEAGLRAFAGDVGIALGCPVEYETWGRVLTAIDTRVQNLKLTTPRGDPREAELQFYTQISEEIRAFNFAWRDPIMHTRSKFEDPKQAENVLNHVNRFMVMLATRIHE